MKMIKGALLIVAVSITSLFIIHGMEPEYKTAGWMNVLRDSILSGTNQFLSYINAEPEMPMLFNFGGLPQEIQRQIIALLGQYNAAQSLKEAGKAINAFARTNKQLNLLMNEPQFCFDLIRFLAKKFKTSDEDAAEAVATKEVQRQYRLQKKLYSYVCNDQWKKFKSDIKILCTVGMPTNKADINFIYKSGKTVLMYAAQELNIELFDFLVEQGADINFANNEGVTALMIVVDSGLAYDSHSGFIRTLMTSHKNFNINQQDFKGNTALMHALMVESDDTGAIRLLLDAGADPELANFDGITPLVYVKNSWDLFENKDAIINLLKQAIKRKYEKDIQ